MATVEGLNHDMEVASRLHGFTLTLIANKDPKRKEMAPWLDEINAEPQAGTCRLFEAGRYTGIRLGLANVGGQLFIHYDNCGDRHTDPFAAIHDLWSLCNALAIRRGFPEVT